MKKNVYTPDNLFFDDMLLFLIMISSGGMGLQLQREGTAIPFEQGQNVVFYQKLTDMEYRFYPYETFRAVFNNKWPVSFELEESEQVTTPNGFKKSKTMPTRIRELWRRLVEVAFVHFFESIRDSIESKYSKECSHWPDLSNFSRVIRNAFAHGGRINIGNQNSPKVVSKSSSYDFQDNGKRVLFDDMAIGDVLRLMEEVDCELRK